MSNLPALEEYYEYVGVATNAGEFIERCEEALRDGAAGRDARVAIAEANSWPKRIGEIMRHIEKKLAEKGQPSSART